MSQSNPEFIGRRLDSIQADSADIRRRMVTLADRFGGIEDRLISVQTWAAGFETRQRILEERMDAMVERQSKLELTSAQTLRLLQRLALKVGGIEDAEG